MPGCDTSVGFAGQRDHRGLQIIYTLAISLGSTPKLDDSTISKDTLYFWWLKVIEQDGIEMGAFFPWMTSITPAGATKAATRENI